MPYKDSEKRKAFNREYNREYMRKWREENQEVARERDMSWRRNNRLQTLIYATKQTAKKKGLEHNITIEDLVQV